MRYYIIAGEASGDLHASNLIKELKKNDPTAVIRGFGGDLMAHQGVEIVKHYRDLAFMGFIEVLANLRTILKNLRFCKSDLIDFKADALILVDYPGFNLRMAEFAHQAGIKTIYYISPQVWAWKKSRVHLIKRTVDLMITILPFEHSFYQSYGYAVKYAGHPLLDALKQHHGTSRADFLAKHQLRQKPIIALLPGSRKQEIRKMLAEMLKVLQHYPDYQFVVGMAPSVIADFYHKIANNADVKFVQGDTYQLLEHAEAALVTSGTASLETALLNVPEVICYKGSFISYLIARVLIKIQFIGLPNLIMGKSIVKELIQNNMNATNLKIELDKLLTPDYAAILKQHYKDLSQRLGGEGASGRAAHMIYRFLKSTD